MAKGKACKKAKMTSGKSTASKPKRAAVSKPKKATVSKQKRGK